MINKPPPFKGLSIRIPIIIPIKGWGCINYGSTLDVFLEHVWDFIGGFRAIIMVLFLGSATETRQCLGAVLVPFPLATLVVPMLT